MTRKRLALGALALAILFAGVAEATNPPRDLKLVGDHWTPWDPPTEFPDGAEVYIIERGDTLWDLSNRFYGDPYLWPQLWERNRYIEDAHWIYPGDPLVVGIGATPIDELADVDSTEEEEARSMFDRSSGGPVALGMESDVYCSGYIADPDRSFPYRILGSEYQNLGPSLTAARKHRRSDKPIDAPSAKVGLVLGDVVYLDGGRAAGLSPGAVFTVVARGDMVRHPETGRLVGRHYAYLGRVRVLSVQADTAIAEIVHSCDRVVVGDYLEPFEPVPVPLRRREPMRGINDPEPWSQISDAPAIVLADDEIVSLGQDHVVYIDAGADGNVQPGDMYTIYRKSATGLPPMVVGELAVLTVHERSAVARILESRYAIYLGDRLSPK